MQQVILLIKNDELEKKLLEEVEKKGKCPETFIIEMLESVLLKGHSTDSGITKFDPLENMARINHPIDPSIDLTNVTPFADVTDSGQYIREIRKKNWSR